MQRSEISSASTAEAATASPAAMRRRDGVDHDEAHGSFASTSFAHAQGLRDGRRRLVSRASDVREHDRVEHRRRRRRADAATTRRDQVAGDARAQQHVERAAPAHRRRAGPGRSSARRRTCTIVERQAARRRSTARRSPAEPRRAAHASARRRRAAPNRRRTRCVREMRPEGIGRSGRSTASSVGVERVVQHHARGVQHADAATSAASSAGGLPLRRCDDQKAGDDVRRRGEDIASAQQLPPGERATRAAATLMTPPAQ